MSNQPLRAKIYKLIQKIILHRRFKMSMTQQIEVEETGKVTDVAKKYPRMLIHSMIIPLKFLDISHQYK